MKRKTWWIALLVLLPAVLVTVLFARWKGAEGAGTTPAEPMALPTPTAGPLLDSMLAELRKGPEMAGRLDTTRPLREAPGWPFAELPLVAKFARPDSQVEEVAALVDSMIPYVPRIDSVLQPLPAPTPSEPFTPLWVLPPLAAAALVTKADVTAVVIPEPRTLILFATGVALLVPVIFKRLRARQRDTRRDDR